MRRVFFLTTAAALLASPATIGGETTGPPEFIRLSAQRRSGLPIANLTVSELRVVVDGEERTPSRLEPETGPVSMGLVIDAERKPASRRDRLIGALRAVLARARPGDEFFAVLSMNQPSLLCDFTTDPERVLSSLATGPAVRSPRLQDAVHLALSHIERAHHRRRVLLVFSDSEDLRSSHTEKGVLSRAIRDAVPVFAVNYTVYFREDFAGNRVWLRRLAGDTGGAYFETSGSEGLARLTAQVDLWKQYRLVLPALGPCSAREFHEVQLRWKDRAAHARDQLHWQHVTPCPAPVSVASTDVDFFVEHLPRRPRR